MFFILPFILQVMIGLARSQDNLTKYEKTINRKGCDTMSDFDFRSALEEMIESEKGQYLFDVSLVGFSEEILLKNKEKFRSYIGIHQRTIIISEI